jgi:predicted PurR-regulated permease PerM
MIALILLSTICVILLILLVVMTRASVKISRQVQAYEEFYNNSLEDIQSVVHMLDTLMNRRQMVSDDPDVQNIYRVVVILHDILVGYRNAWKTQEGKEKEK